MNFKRCLIILVMVALCPCFSGAVHAGVTNELVNILMSRLGVTEQQAAGGAGAIFKTAQDTLKPDEFKQLESSVPGVDSLIKEAPALTTEKSSGGWGSAFTSMAKQASPDLGAAAELSQSFDKLGLEKQMIGKFADIIGDYCKEKGGQMAQSLIQKAIPF